MPSHVRPATEEDKGLAVTFSGSINDANIRKVVVLREIAYGLRVIVKRSNLHDIRVLMPSGNVFCWDTRESGSRLDESILASKYKGDMTPVGEVANAVSYACFYKNYLDELIASESKPKH